MRKPKSLQKKHLPLLKLLAFLAALFVSAGARAAAASLAAPGAGLFLEAVRYKGDAPLGPVRPIIRIT